MRRDAAAHAVSASGDESLARLSAKAGNGAAGASRSTARGSTMVMGIANLAMATANLARSGGRKSPARPEQCDLGPFPHEHTGYRHVSDESVRKSFEAAWACGSSASRLRIPKHVRSSARWGVQESVQRGRRAISLKVIRNAGAGLVATRDLN